ncbi:MAG: sulfotransferase domain-containing protein [Chloroflexota bacterium]
MMENNYSPTIFNITHIKSGSQWVRAVLTECAPKRIVIPKVGITQFYEDPLLTGAVYPALYIPYADFEKVLTQSPARQHPHIEFVVIRDLRDTLVSLYFSVKVSHPLIAKQLVDERNALNGMTLEEGLSLLIQTRMDAVADIQRSWLPVCKDGGALLVRYEDLLADEQAVFAKIVSHCQFNIPPQQLRDIVARNSFENQTGRHKGEEDTSSHYRKGIVGDWRNVFSPKVVSEFKSRFGDVLIQTGYETDLDW